MAQLHASNCCIAHMQDGSTALHLASREGHISTVGLLLQKGADVNVGNTGTCYCIVSTVTSPCSDCFGLPRRLSLHGVVLTQRDHCSQNAVNGSQLHCPYIHSLLTSRVSLQREVTIQTVKIILALCLHLEGFVHM